MLKDRTAGYDNFQLLPHPATKINGKVEDRGRENSSHRVAIIA
jgi:hypothetical protein